MFNIALADHDVHAQGACDHRTKGLDLGSSFPIYFAGFVGTVLAGGLFPSVLMLLGGFGPPTSDSLLFAFVGFPIGAVLAGIAAFAIFPLVAGFQYLASLYRRRVALASCAGGWSGFASVIAMGGTDDSLFRRPLVIAFAAMTMGQLGAALAARRAKRWQLATGAWSEPDRSSQISLRQLFGIMSAAAVIATLLAVLHLPRGTLAAIGIGVAIQAVVVILIGVGQDRTSLAPSTGPIST
jgi:hypothetical protein